MSTMCRPRFWWFISSGTSGIRRKVYDFHRNLKVTSFVSLKPYGDMPKVMVWDKFAFIGKDKYEMKLERRDH